MLAPPAWKKFFDANLIQISLTQFFILELSKNRIQKLYLCSESKTRARSETNNYKRLWIALLIGFQIRIELLNLESKPERDLKQIIIKVFESRSWSVSTNKNRTFEFRIQTRARSETNNYKRLWIALLIGFHIRIELLNLESKPEHDLKQIILKVFGSRSWSISENKLMF